MGQLTAWFDLEFARLYTNWRKMVEDLEPENIYQTSLPGGVSRGEQVLRSARVVEQTFGGITANLWDDPFEWTLPENLTTPEKLVEYFDEVETTRRRGFESLRTDDDLMKEVMTPAGKMALASLLLETLVRARQHLDARLKNQ
jgi:hypothetical protein